MASSRHGIGLTSSSETMATSNFTNAIENCRPENIIAELANRLSQREAEVRTLTKAKQELEKKVTSNGENIQVERAYESLLYHLREREEEFGYISQKNERLVARQQELEKLGRELQNNVDSQRCLLQEREEKIKDLEHYRVQREKQVQNETQKLTSQLDETIESLRVALDERNVIINKLSISENTVNRLANEVACLKENEKKDQVFTRNLALEVESQKKQINDLEALVSEKTTEIEKWKTQDKNLKRQVESKDCMLNLVREENQKLLSQLAAVKSETAEKEKTIDLYEKRLEGTGINMSELIENIDEAEKKWAKIEEREKRYAAKEIFTNLLREENEELHIEQKRLREEVIELKETILGLEVQFSGENVDMSYFLTQIRESNKLKNKTKELEEIIKREGYVASVDAAEKVLKEKEKKLVSEVEALQQMTGMLKKVLEEKEIKVPRLVGKLEECIVIFSDETGLMERNDFTESGSLKASVDSFDEKELDGYCQCLDEDDVISLSSKNSQGGERNASNGTIFRRLIRDMRAGIRSMRKDGLCSADTTKNEPKDAISVENDAVPERKLSEVSDDSEETGTEQEAEETAIVSVQEEESI